MELQRESPEEVKQRIFKAADELFEEGGRLSIPTVTKVRKRAGTSQAAASDHMNEWRDARERALSNPAVEVPQEVQAALDEARVRVWSAATRCAKREFDGNRAELERALAASKADRADVSAAFDEQAAQLHAANECVSALRLEVVHKDEQLAELSARLAAQSEELVLARAKAEFGETQTALLRGLHEAEQKRSSNLEAELIDHVRVARKKAGTKKGRRPAEQREASSSATSLNARLFDDGRP